MLKKMETQSDILRILSDKHIRLVKADLYGHCKGMVRKSDYGYLVIIEETLSFDCLLDTLKHELRHILFGHLDDDIKTEEEKEEEVLSVVKTRRS